MNAGDSSIMVLQNTGNVGIGTTAPTQPLDVQTNTNGTIGISFTNSSTGTSARSRFTISDGTNYSTINQNGANYPTDPNMLSIFSPSTGSYPLSLGTNGTERLRIAGNGNVGIGTTNPGAGYRLDVAGSTINLTSAGNASLRLEAPSGVSFLDLINGTGTTNTRIYGGVGGTSNISFATGGGTLTEKMRIENSGNVGIGTTAPARLLHVNGPMRVQPAALPGSPAAGDIAIDSGAANALKWYDGSIWQTVSNGSGTFSNVTSISDSGGNITLAPAVGTGSVIVNSGFAATSSVTGALTVTGGAGVSGDIYSGASINAGTSLTVGTNGFIPQLYGSSASAGNIKIDGTSNATKGNVLLATAGGYVGIGTNAPGAPLAVSATQTGTSGNDYLLNLSYVVNPSANRTGASYGENMLLQVSGTSTTASVYASSFESRLNGSGALNGLYGSTGTARVNSTAPVTNAYGAWNQGVVQAASTVTNLAGAVNTAYITAASGGPTVATAIGSDNHFDNYYTAGTPVAKGIATQSFYNNNGTSTVTNGYGESILLSNAGTTSNLYGVRVTPTLTGTTSSYYGIYLDDPGSSSYYGIYSAGSAKSYFGGNVGIGTTAPNQPLTVNGAAQVPTIYGGSGATQTLALTNTSGNSNSSGINIGSIYNSDNGGVSFFTAGAATTTERMRIMGTSGNVGIGTTAPETQMDIIGPTQGTVTTIGSEVPGLILQQRQSGSLGAMMEFRIYNGAETWSSGAIVGNSGGSYAGGLSFFTQPGGATDPAGRRTQGASLVERLSITGAGSVGIGTTAPSAPLTVYGGISVPTLTHASTSNFNIPSSGGTDLVFSAATGSPYAYSIQNRNANSDGSSYPISLNPLGGNVGIGTTAPGNTLTVATTGAGISSQFRDLASANPGIQIGADANAGWVGNSAMSTGEGIYYQNSSNWMRIFTNSTERIRIDQVGNVGIGITSPGARLDVADTGTTTSAIIVPRAGAFTGTTVNGMVRYNSTSNLFEFYQNGAWVNYTTVSDARLKTNVVPVTSTQGLDIVNQLNPVFYDWDKSNPRTETFGDKHQVGFIAQEVEKVLPEVVDVGEDSYRSVQYGKIVSVAVAAIKELYNKVLGIADHQVAQDREIASVRAEADAKAAKLEAENQKLKQDNSAIKAYLCSKDPKAVICK